MSTKSKMIWLITIIIVTIFGIWKYQTRPVYSNINSPRPISGNANAPIVLEEFSDFQCPACRAVQPMVESILQTYGKNIAFYYRHFPLINIHPNAFPAALAVECANDQGKFWEYHDELFSTPEDLNQSTLLKIADKLQLDKKSFSACLKSRAKTNVVNADMQEGERRKVDSTPSFFINGQLVDDLRKLPDLIGAEVNKLDGIGTTTNVVK